MIQQPVALVTGGSRGIGRGICQELAKAGYAVAINFLSNEPAARETQASLPPDSISCLVKGDVGSASDRESMVDQVVKNWQRIDVLVNNAGITSVGRRDILEATEASWDQVLATNLKGPFFLTQKIAQIMVHQKKHNSLPSEVQGTIINISSLSAYALSTNRGDYCISKAGLGMMTQLFALRLAEYGIGVFEIRPGIIDTDMTAGSREKYTQLIAQGLTPIRRWGFPQDVGQVVVSLAKGALPFSTGEVIHVDGGYHLRKFP